MESKNSFAMSRNHVERTLGKSSADFTRADIIDYISLEGIEMVNFMYVAADGRLKTLNFVINSLEYLETILSTGSVSMARVCFLSLKQAEAICMSYRVIHRLSVTRLPKFLH